MKPKHRRMLWLAAGALMVCGGAALIIDSFSRHLVYFYTPTQLQAQAIAPTSTIRVGGLVEIGSVTQVEPQTIRFVITDLAHRVDAEYSGVLPGLFREGQGVVAQGTLTSAGLFKAQTILAKHDENYMPPEVVEALKASGRWQDYSEENIKTFKP